MQGGEDRRRGGGRAIVVTVACVAAAAFLDVPAAATVVWRSATCGGRRPETVWRPSGTGEGAAAGCLVARANPYGLDGLSRTGLVAFVDRPPLAISAGWEAVRYALYRRDRMEGAAIVRSLGGRLFAGFAGSTDQRKVTGFDRRRSGEWEPVLGGRFGAVSAAWAGSAGGSRGWRVSARLGPCRICLDAADRRDRVVSGEYRRGCIALHAGIREKSGEAAIGVSARRKRILAGVAWAHHPWLGSTVTVHAGWIGCVAGR